MEPGGKFDRKVTVAMTLVAGGLHVFFTSAGRINGDEGAYLNFARLVARGELPYRDFALTQMPLLPYVHALPQTLFGPSLLVGRLTSLAFAFATIALGVDAARRVAGTRATAIAATFFAGFTFGAYMNSITKTHAVASFFLVAALWALTQSWDERVRIPVAVGCAALATLDRLSCLAFAVALFVAGVREPRTRARAIVVAGVASAVAIAFAAADLEAARWGLSEFHLRQWATTGTSRIGEIVIDRLPRVAILLAPVAALTLLAMRGADNQRTKSLVTILGGATVAFVLLHLVTGQWHDEYLVPAVAVVIPLCAVTLARRDIRWQTIGTMAVAASMVLQGMRFVALDDGRSPLIESAAVADVVAENSEPGDPVFALSALWAAVEAERDVPRGFELLSDGIIEDSDARARRLHVVNTTMLTAIIEREQTPVVVLTPIDRFAIWKRGGTEALASFDRALNGHYRLRAEFENVGQSVGVTKIYVLSPSRAR